MFVLDVSLVTRVLLWLVYRSRLIRICVDKFSTSITLMCSIWNNVWLHSSVGRATHRQRGVHGFESRWSPDFFFFFFQASSFQLLKFTAMIILHFYLQLPFKVVFQHECHLLNLIVSPWSGHVLEPSLTLIVTYIRVPVLVYGRVSWV